jgi:cob(I)alamin adenosyltransferase
MLNNPEYIQHKKTHTYNMLTRITTKTGDKGKTFNYWKKQFIVKHDLQIQAEGDVDELNSQLGVVQVLLNNNPQTVSLAPFLKDMQSLLFEIGADLALPNKNRITPEHTARLDVESRRMNADLPSLESFVIPGTGSLLNAHLHVARTVARRAERQVVAYHDHIAGYNSQEESVNPETLRFLNRMSDYLFVLSRYVDQNTELWKPQPKPSNI